MAGCGGDAVWGGGQGRELLWGCAAPRTPSGGLTDKRCKRADAREVQGARRGGGGQQAAMGGGLGRRGPSFPHPLTFPAPSPCPCSTVGVIPRLLQMAQDMPGVRWVGRQARGHSWCSPQPPHSRFPPLSLLCALQPGAVAARPHAGAAPDHRAQRQGLQAGQVGGREGGCEGAMERHRGATARPASLCTSHLMSHPLLPLPGSWRRWTPTRQPAGRCVGAVGG
jgi:hypothetical protein